MGSKLFIRVIPNARQSAFGDWAKDEQGRDVLKLRIAARPVDGAANAEIVRFLAEKLGVAKSTVRMDKGASGRNKCVIIDGLDPDALHHRLNEIAPCPKP